jgi:hypothetical protein
VSGGNNGILSCQQAGGLTQFLRIRGFLVNLLLLFSTVQRVFIVEHYFRTLSYEVVKLTAISGALFLMLLYLPNKSTISRLGNQRRYSSQNFYEYVETG